MLFVIDGDRSLPQDIMGEHLPIGAHSMAMLRKSSETGYEMDPPRV